MAGIVLYWIIDPGPEEGSKGGEIIFEGTPQALVKEKRFLTAQYLRG
jgi:excinuclease ABC subunit A